MEIQSKHLKFINGHFYDSINGKRVEIKDNAKICIVASGTDFVTPPPVGRWPVEPKTSEILENELRNESEIEKYKKIKDAGNRLFFQVNRKDNSHVVHHEFEVELLEDLYLFKKKGWDEAELYDCVCVVRKNISGTIEMFEEVYGKSLNEVFKNNFVHYFGNKGNPACNAIDRFYEKAGQDELKLKRHRKI